MEQEKRPHPEVENIDTGINPESDEKSDIIDQQINSELGKRSDLILDNPKLAPIAEKLGEHASLKKHLEEGQWLNEDQLKVLDLDPETNKAYSELREFYEKQETETDDDRLLEHLKKKNEEIKNKNEADKEAYFKELAYIKAQSLEELLEKLFSFEYHERKQWFGYKQGVRQKYLSQLRELANDPALRLAFKSAEEHVYDLSFYPKSFVDAYFSGNISFEKINNHLDKATQFVKEQILTFEEQKEEEKVLEKKSKRPIFSALRPKKVYGTMKAVIRAFIDIFRGV